MLLTTKGRYAVMAMTDIALNSGVKPVRLADIAERQHIDVGYLEQIFVMLKKAGLVEAVRGPGGGYVLSRSMEKISVFEIMVAVDENIKMTRCDKTDHEGCLVGGVKCMTHNLWEAMSKRLEGFLLTVSIGDVCNKKIGRGDVSIL